MVLEGGKKTTTSFLHSIKSQSNLSQLKGFAARMCAHTLNILFAWIANVFAPRNIDSRCFSLPSLSRSFALSISLALFLTHRHASSYY